MNEKMKASPDLPGLKTWLSASFLAVVLGVSVVFPSAVVSADVAASTGLSLIVTFYLLTYLLVGKVPANLNDFIRLFGVMLAIAILVLLHGLSCAYVNNAFNFRRFSSSFAYLIFFLSGAVSFTFVVERLRDKEFGRAVKFVFYLLLVSGALAALGFSPWFTTEKPVFFFSEPSHFALAVLPFLLYVMAISSGGFRALALFCTLLLGALLENLTMFIGILLIAYLLYGFFRTTAVVAMATLLLALSTPNGINYYLSRLDFLGESGNFSVLVYRNGWEKAQLNLIETGGLGIGLNQLGYVGASGDAAQQLVKYAGVELNAKDGGTVASKLVNEFGVFGIILLTIYFFCFVRYARRLRIHLKISDERLDCREVFFLSSFLTYSIDLFVRGAGYFSVPSFLLIASLVLMFLRGRRKSRLDLKAPTMLG